MTGRSSSMSMEVLLRSEGILAGLDCREGRPTVVLLIDSFKAMHDNHSRASTIRNAALALDVSEQNPSQNCLAFQVSTRQRTVNAVAHIITGTMMNLVRPTRCQGTCMQTDSYM